MKTLRLALLSLATISCGSPTPTPGGECYQEDVQILLDCGPQSDRSFDDEGREVDFCAPNDPAGGRDCIIDSINVHCMPRAYCETRCTNGSFVCD